MNENGKRIGIQVTGINPDSLSPSIVNVGSSPFTMGIGSVVFLRRSTTVSLHQTVSGIVEIEIPSAENDATRVTCNVGPFVNVDGKRPEERKGARPRTDESSCVNIDIHPGEQIILSDSRSRESDPRKTASVVVFWGPAPTQKPSNSNT